MNKDYTHVTLLLDKSGSMATVRDEVLKGYKQFVKDQKGRDDKCTVSIVAFSSRDSYKTLFDFVDVNDLPDDISEEYNCSGFTALNDSFARAMDETGLTLKKMAESERPARVLFFVQTDGEENNSREHTIEEIKNAVKHQEEVYNWQFVFLGADINSVRQASGFGIHQCNVAQYGSTRSVAAGMSMSVNKARVLSKSNGVYSKESLHFTEEEREELNK